jgi:hypothetical protein
MRHAQRLRWWLADRLRPNEWPSTAAQHGVLLDQIKELHGENERLRRDLAIESRDFGSAADRALHYYAQSRVLLDAAYRVPVKQHDRTPEEQDAVEEFTTAVVETRAMLRELTAPKRTTGGTE